VYAYEISPIVRAGWSRCTPDSNDPNAMCYLTVYNEPLVQSPEPEDIDLEGIVRGIYRVREGNGDGPTVQLLTSGVAVPWVIEAVDLLHEKWVSAPTPGR
jgi:pyruvate dehydrogenase E1 component